MLETEDADLLPLLDPSVVQALNERGFTALTPVQRAVLAPHLAGRDLRISSQTGSGKTVAIGFAIRACVGAVEKSEDRRAHPRAIVIGPTRELVRQIEGELRWLFAASSVEVVSVTGGAGYRDELRALSRGPAIVVGTPGRLLDHLTRASILTDAVVTMVLDEADRMLDMGFREELEKIFDFAPAARQTHLVSATFPREVRALADRLQKDPVAVEGTRLGEANSDIDHVLHIVEDENRVDAIINLMLASPGDQTLIFCRTRADVGNLTRALSKEGFPVGSLSGDMEQAARNRALSAFRRGQVCALVATDVAARGIDVQAIARVIQMEPPNDPDTYTHRSGRTGRAGRKGTSTVFVHPRAVRRVKQMFRSGSIDFKFQPIPGPDEIRKSVDEQLLESLLNPEPDVEADESNHYASLAVRIIDSDDAPRAVARLIAKLGHGGPTAARELPTIAPPDDRQREKPGARGRDRNGPGGRPTRWGDDAPSARRGGGDRRPAPAGGWVPFRVTWGQNHGADSRRMLAMLCRRGDISSSAVGGIRIGPTSSVVEIAKDTAAGFARIAGQIDPRDPRIHIRAEGAPPAPPSGPGMGGSPRKRPPPPTFAGMETADARDEQPSSDASPGPQAAKPFEKKPFEKFAKPFEKKPFDKSTKPFEKKPFEKSAKPFEKKPFDKSAKPFGKGPKSFDKGSKPFGKGPKSFGKGPKPFGKGGDGSPYNKQQKPAEGFAKGSEAESAPAANVPPRRRIIPAAGSTPAGTKPPKRKRNREDS